MSLGANGEPVFLGRDYAERSDYSDDTARRIDAEITRLVESGHRVATETLTARRELLDRLARELLERESLEGAEVYDLIEELTGERLGPAPSPAPGRKAPAAEETVAASAASLEEEPEPDRPGPAPLPAPST